MVAEELERTGYALEVEAVGLLLDWCGGRGRRAVRDLSNHD